MNWINTSTRCTLRAAIQEANAYTGADQITFSNSMYISLATELPMIGEQLRIDAGGVWDSTNNRPGITLDCVSRSFRGLILPPSSGSSEIYGLFIINCTDGITIYSAANTIGSTVAYRRNVISNNNGNGIFIDGSSANNNVVMGNWIGLNTSGDGKSPNNNGVLIHDAPNNTIGGDTQLEGNYISGNLYDGIIIQGSGAINNDVDGNIIGRSASGSHNVGNGVSGVYIWDGANGNWIGVARFNTISSNTYDGLLILGSNQNLLWYNNIYENGGCGVNILSGASYNLVFSNTIIYNGYDGINIDGASTTHNSILSNRIHHNGRLGIYLSNGGNNSMPAPVITSATSTNVSGTGCSNCTIEVFADWNNQGETYLGWVNANATGDWTFNGSIQGPYITATNTATSGNTSQFSTPKALNVIFLPMVIK